MPERNCTSHAAPPDVTICRNTGRFSDALTHCGHTNSWVPWFGQSKSQHIKNAGFVIGFKDNTKEGHSLRLDFDNVKGLHVNEIKANGDRDYHIVTNIDTVGVPSAYLPDGFKQRNLTGEQKQHLMWFTWTRMFIPFMKDADQQAVIAHKQGMPWGTFKKAILDANKVKDIAWALT